MPYSDPIKQQEYFKQYRENVKERTKEYLIGYRARTKDKRKEYDRARYLKDKKSLNEKARLNYIKTKDRIVAKNAEYSLKRRKEDHLYKLILTLRTRINNAFRGVGWKRGKSKQLLGCEWSAVKAHIESKFCVGMSWENHGKWHIDHIIPLASAKSPEDMEGLCHYTNLQPLWAHDNHKKSKSLTWQK